MYYESSDYVVNTFYDTSGLKFKQVLWHDFRHFSGEEVSASHKRISTLISIVCFSILRKRIVVKRSFFVITALYKSHYMG